MSLDIRASAPGKLLILGEYAVLEGAPAIVCAVDRRAQVSLQTGRELRLSAPQLGLDAFDLDADGAIPENTPAQTRAVLRLFSAVTHTINECFGAPPPLHIHIDTGQFFHGGHKVGIGSSAAVAVALTGALAAAQGQTLDNQRLFELAARAHQRAQGGVGSNVDIAASVYGGSLVHRINTAPTPISLPEELILQPVFTGQAASTPNLVGAVYKLREQNPDEFSQRMQQMTELAELGCTACRHNDVNALLATAGHYHEAMRALGRAAGVEITSGDHETLGQIADASGAAYKPSGAGGGDIGLLFLRKTQARGPIVQKVTQAGFEPLELGLRAPGFKVM